MKLQTHIPNTLVTALCVLLLSPALVFAGHTPKRGEERGIIKSVDMGTHTLVVAKGKSNSEQKFQWNDQTKFSERRKSVDPSVLKEGERVLLTYAPGGDAPILKSVHIAPPKPEKHTANNLSPARSDCAAA